MRALYRGLFRQTPLLALLGLTLALSACGGRDAEDKDAQDAGAPGGLEQRAAIAEPAAPAGPPVVGALGLMPASAQIAMGVPSVAALEEEVFPLLSRLMGAEARPEEQLRELAGNMGRQVDLEAETVSDLAAAVGIDPAGPMALFADLTPLVDEGIRVAQAQQQANTAAQTAPEDEEEATTYLDAEDTLVEFEAEPFFVAVFTVTDAALAEQKIAEAAAKDGTLANQTPEDVDVGGVTLKVYDAEKFVYFISGDRVVLGNRLSLLQEAAARVTAPQAFAYGQPEFPASGDGEVGVFLFGQRLTPLIARAEEAMVEFPGAQGVPMAEQLGTMRTMFASATADEPWFYGLSWTRASLALHGRVNTATYPGMLESAGTPGPLRLAQILPPSTLAFISLQFTEAMKQQIDEAYLSNSANLSGDFALGAGPARQVLSMLKDELTFGVAAVENDLPALVLMARLSEPQATKGLLGMFVPTEVAETHQEVPIETVLYPTPVPLSLVLMDDVLAVSNHVAGLKQLIDAHKSGAATPMLTQLEPPMPPDTPRYFAFHLDSRLFSDILVPLAKLFGGMPPGVAPVTDRVASEIRQVRAVSELEDGWAVTHLEVNFR